MRHQSKIKGFLKGKLSTDPRWATRAVVKLYERQTATEQQIGMTREHNSIGFSGTDSEFLSSIAEKLNKGWNLTEKQMSYVFKMVPKYWAQVWSMIPQDKQEQILSKIV
jgi:hypothetical protein